MPTKPNWASNVLADLYSPIVRTMKQSTCQKRAVVCVLFDDKGQVVSMQSNNCNPEGVCRQLSMVTTKENYPRNGCNSEHAEIRALKLARRMPKRALLIGHNFLCDDCERLLKSYGIEIVVLGDK